MKITDQRMCGSSLDREEYKIKAATELMGLNFTLYLGNNGK